MPRRRAGVLLPLEERILQIGLARASGATPEFYGFALAEELAGEESGGRLLGHGTLYKALARLEAAGALESRWEEVDASAEGRPPRRLYRVTAHAAVALAQSQAAQQDWVSGVRGLAVE